MSGLLPTALPVAVASEPCSGAQVFEKVTPPRWSVDLLKKMVLRENELRLSSHWQLKFQSAEARHDTDWLECVAALQLQVVREFGLSDVVAGAHALRTARYMYPDEPFFQQVPIYVKYNWAKSGSLRMGDEVENVPLVRLGGEVVSLWEMGGDEEPLVVIGGSHS